MTGKLGKYLLNVDLSPPSLSSLARTVILIAPHRSSFVSAWQSSMRVHEMMAENRLRFAQRLNEMSDELSTLVKEVEKNRKHVCVLRVFLSPPLLSLNPKLLFSDGFEILILKQTKELATRYERALQDSETITEKCKNRLEVSSEELERVLLQKEGESFKDTAVQSRSGGGVAGKRAIGKAVAKGGLLLKGKNPGNVRVPFVLLVLSCQMNVVCLCCWGQCGSF